MSVQMQRTLAIVVLLLASGCSDPVIRRRQQARVDSINSTLHELARAERSRPPRLHESGEAIAHLHAGRIAKLSTDFENLRDWNRDQLKAWQENQPAYQDEIRRIWAGNPNIAAETARSFLD